MSNDLTTLAGRLVAQAAKTLPKNTGETGAYGRRFAGATDATVILCDVSGSMADSAGSLRKIEHLREALANVLPEIAAPHLICFGSTATEIYSPHVPEPSGGTAMHLGLDAAARHRPRRTIVISDGLPDSETDALAAAERLTGTIDVIYCGPDSDAKALEFMRRLARIGAGRVVVRDLKKSLGRELAGDVRGLLK